MKVSTITYSCPYDGGQKLYQSGIRDNVFAIMELANTSCANFIECDDDFIVESTVTVPLLKRFMYQISSGVAYLHNNNVCNRDIKSGNVLIFKDPDYSDAYNAVICDLGMCKPMTPNILNSDHIGTSSYKSPEVLLGYSEYSYAIDIWSLGILFFELFNLYLPFERQRTQGARQKSKVENNEILNKIFRNRGSPSLKTFNHLTRRSESIIDFGKISQWSKKSISKLYNKKSRFIQDFEEISEGLPNFGSLDNYTDLLEKCLDIDYKNRPTIFEVINHPFFNDIPDAPKAPRILKSDSDSHSDKKVVNVDQNQKEIEDKGKDEELEIVKKKQNSSSVRNKQLDMWRGLNKIPLENPIYHILKKTSNTEKRMSGFEIIETVSIKYYDIAPRILFLGLDIYDRCLLKCENDSIEIDEKMLAYASIYISGKYFLDESIPSFGTIFPGKDALVKDKQFVNDLILMEQKILLQFLNWEIYRVTVYDLLNDKTHVSILFAFLKSKDKAYGHKVDKLARIFEKTAKK
tara:strand:- start:3855 stop:5411 length:1557 start_codon:yes stop_codon:yes gene_type:complete